MLLYSNNTVLNINFPEESFDRNMEQAFNNKMQNKNNNNKNTNNSKTSKRMHKNKFSTTTPALTSYTSSSINTQSYMGKLILNKNVIVYKNKSSKDKDNLGGNFK